MAGPDPLVVWLHGVAVARVDEARTGKLNLQYSDAALSRWRLNTPLLSVSLPLTAKRYPPGVATPYLEGLLPEGDARTVLERYFDVRRGDTHGLLSAIGRDCAGAVVVQPESAPPPSPRSGRVDWIGTEEVARLIRDLPVHPLGAGDDVRVSLAGQQSKLLLVYDDGMGWGVPRAGHPSTHILKPEDQRYPAMAANESFCLRVAGELGLTTVVPEVIELDGRPVLVVPRYDRTVDASGRLRRRHQEDVCQALGIDTSLADRKYETFGGPALADVAVLLDRHNGAIAQLDLLVEVATFTVVVGNADAHGRNLSLVHPGDGTVELAPLYDVVSTIAYPTVATPDGDRPVSTDLAMAVNGRDCIHEVTAEDLVSEAAAWPYARRRAVARVQRLLERLPAAVHSAAGATPGLPTEIPERILARAEALTSGHTVGQGTRPPS